jgi:hypothetical protein
VSGLLGLSDDLQIWPRGLAMYPVLKNPILLLLYARVENVIVNTVQLTIMLRVHHQTLPKPLGTATTFLDAERTAGPLSHTKDTLVQEQLFTGTSNDCH